MSALRILTALAAALAALVLSGPGGLIGRPGRAG